MVPGPFVPMHMRCMTHVQVRRLIVMSMLASRRLRHIAVLIVFLLMTALPVSAVETITAHSNINLNATVTDFDTGEKVTSNNTMNWTSDVDWVVTVKSLDANLGQDDGLTYTKPLGDLLWKLSSNSTWTAITTSDATVTSDVFGGGSGNFDMDYKFLLAWSLDLPGSYGATLQFTISAQ